MNDIGMRTAARNLAWCAMACWLASWFLPVLDDYAGWAAFRAAMQGPFRDPFPTRGEHAIGQILSALTNVVFIALFLNLVRGRVARPWLFTKAALVCLLLNLYWLVEMIRAGERGALLVGYYTWLAAFALLVASGVISAVSDRRTSKTPRADTPS
jgi:hypothetical protein